jgi:hypothetical protein
MDPNAALEQIRSGLETLKDLETKDSVLDENGYADNVYDDVEVSDLINLIEGLDQWLSSGGFLPKEWKR